MAAAVAGAAAAGSFCAYYHRIDADNVRLLDIPKLMSAEVFKQTTLFEGWSLLGGSVGAIAGAVWSWRVTRMLPYGDNLFERDHDGERR